MKSKRNNDLLKDLASLEKEKIYRDWWRFQYTNRHFKQLVLVDESMNEKVDQAFRWITKTFDRFKSPRMYPVEQEIEYLGDLFAFTNCLVYAYHKQTRSDGFVDIRYEALLYEHDFPLKKIPFEDIEFVEYLHELTLEFGFLVLPLDARPDHIASWEVFVDKVPDIDPTKVLVQTYSYPKKGDHPKGIQISTTYHPREIEDGWDMVIFCQLDDAFSHLKEQITALWGQDGKLEVGELRFHDIALFVERDKCTPTSVLKVLRLQMMWTLINQMNRSLTIVDETGEGSFTDVRPYKKLRKLDSDVIEAIRVSEGLIEKRKEVGKDNIRRTIGLYLWDMLNESSAAYESKDSLIKETFQMLEEEAPFVLDSYRTGYKNLRGKQEVYETVVREMRKDIALTDYGVEHADFFTANQVKHSS